MDNIPKGVDREFLCPNCKLEREVIPEDVKQESPTFGPPVSMTIYTCPACGQKTLVQLDDGTTTQLAHKLIYMTTRVEAGRRMGHSPDRDRIKKISKLERDLSNKRKELKEKYWSEAVDLLSQKQE